MTARARPRVIVTETVHEDALALLRNAGWQVIGPGAAMRPAEALLVRTRKVSAEQVADFALISKHGVGVDNIPLSAARKAGVAVMNTPGANAGAVAEQALMLMLALARDLDGQRTASAAGGPPPRIGGLEGRRLLVIGFGASGRRLAGLAAAMGMVVTVRARSLHGTVTPEGYGMAQDLLAALGRADVISLHCPLTPETRHLLDGAALAALPQGALVINCARGGLVDEAALGAALKTGHLGGAGLDVTESEPLPRDHPLRHIPRLILTPHASAMSDGAFRRMGMEAARNILDHFAGEPRPECVVLAASRP